MTDEDKTREQLLEELEAARQRNVELEANQSELKRTEGRARESEERYRTLVEENPHGVQVIDSDGIIVFANAAHCEMFGYEEAELVGRSIADFLVPGPQRDELPRYLRTLVEDQPAPTPYSQKNLKKGGEARDVEVSWNYLRDKEGHVRGFISVLTDVTERMRAKELLQSERHRLFALLEQLPAFVYLQAPDYSIRFANGYYRQHFGDTEGVPCYKTLWGREEPCEVCPTFRVFDTGVPQVWEWLEAPNGRVYQVYDYPFTDTDGSQLVLELGIDITERKRAEEERRNLEAQVQHAQKLESLGVLAGGIAHDFNNILTGLLGNADLAAADLPSHSPIRRLLHEIQKAGRRAADLTAQMLAYSGKGRFVVEDTDINALVEDMSSLLESSTSKKVRLSYDLSADLPAVRADATQLRQIVLNLVSNASEAVGDKAGLVRVCTQTSDCDRPFLDAALPDGELVEGRYVTIEVRDTGCGMDDETKARIFDPFFTTKFTGRGLGLAAVRGIVRGHKGAILVESELGTGTTFKVLLPALDHPAEAVATGTKENDWHGTGTILVVDDEEMIRTVAARMLERAGLSVLTASDGIEAIELLRERRREIDCVLLDLKMPRMDGEETFEEIRKISDGVPVILTSGYSQLESEERFAGKGLAGFIQKPYSMTALREKLAQFLGR